MDTVTAIISAIVAKDSNTSINIEKIREDYDAIIKRQGSLSESGILKYAEQYVSSWKKNSGEKFWDANVNIIDWTTDYTLNTSNPLDQKTEEIEIKSYKGETVIVNHDFTVKIPEDLTWSTKKSEIGQGNVLAMMSGVNSGFQKPEDAFLYFELQDPYQMTDKGFLDTENQQVINMVQNAIGVQFNAIVPNVQISAAGSGNVVFAINKPTFLPMKNGWIVGYSLCNGNEHLVALIGIANDVYLYTGKLWMAEMPEQKKIEKMVLQVASSLGFPTKEENSIVAGNGFTPAYAQRKKVIVKNAYIPVPDQMISNVELKTNVPKFTFVCIPEGFEDGLISYKVASIGIGMLELGKLDWKDQWDDKYDNRKASSKVHRELSSLGIRSITDVSIDNRLYTGYFFVQESQPGPDYYCAYQYVIIVEETILAGMIYFNVQKPRTEYEKIIKEWLSRISLSEERKQKIEQEIKAIRIAKEARRKAEAEAKAKREEELRRYDEAHKKWESEKADINAKRSAFVDAKIDEEKTAIVVAAAKKRDETIAKANAIMEEQADRKAKAESVLASLGMFKFGEKKTQKSIIEDATKLLADAQTSIAVAETTYVTEMNEADKKALSKRAVFQMSAENKFPMPVEPKKPR